MQLLVGVVVAAMATVSSAGLAAPLPVSPGSERICVMGYDSDDSDGDDSGLYAVPVAGGLAERLPDFNGAIACPSWSARHPRVAYSAPPPEGGAWELFTARPDGTGVRRLTDNSTWEAEPLWSPGGRRIAYESWGESGPREIRIMRPKTGATRVVARGHLQGWSPDGTRLLITRARGIHVVDIVDGSVRRLTPRVRRVTWPTANWSNDGTLVAVTRVRVYACGGEPCAETGLFTIRPDGTGLTELIDDRDLVSVGDPIWFPDDSRILFTGCRYGCRPHTIDPRGGPWQEVPILNGATYDDFTSPSWMHENGPQAIGLVNCLELASLTSTARCR